MRPKRLPGFDYRGCHRYFITCCTWKRQLLFDHAAVSAVRDAMQRTFDERGLVVLAYVFMPDHVHWLLESTTDAPQLSAAMKLARQRAALAFRSQRSGQLWQDGYFERVLRRNEETKSVIRYVLNNPVRAGLVTEPADYPFSWSIDDGWV
jgi:putative transposase